MSNYKIGDIVEVFDGSWSLAIENGQLRDSWGIELRDRDFEVLYTDLKLPSTDKERFNTTILKAKDNGQIVFIKERMFRPKKVEEPKVYNLTCNIIIDPDSIEDVQKKIEEDIHKKIQDYIKNSYCGCSDKLTINLL